jgi:phage-related protein
MRNYNATFTEQISAESARLFWLVEFQFSSGTYRYTDADIPMKAASGEPYLPRPLRVNVIDQRPGFAVNRVDLELSNVDRAISTIFFSQDCAGKTAVLSARATYALGRGMVTEELFRGVVLGWGDMDEVRAPIRLGSQFMLWKKRSLRLPTPSCPWVFKGSECAYSGDEDWCDQSYARCEAIGNKWNFGGRRFISSLEGKKIFWGPDPDKKP